MLCVIHFGKNIKPMNQINKEDEEIDEADLEVVDEESDDIEFEEEDEDYDLGEKKIDEPEATRAIVIPLTQTQYEVVMMAIQHVRDQFDYPIMDGKAVELICIEFLNSPEGTTGMDQI